MKTIKKYEKKDFDAAKFMRDLRDKISKEIADFTPKQIKEYCNKKILQKE